MEKGGAAEVYDAVIVGAGLGGLTAAARLLKEGLRVLVVESDPHPGGTAYLYGRKGYLFPMGPLGFSNPEAVSRALTLCGISAAEQELALRRVHYRLRAFGLEVPLSLPYAEMIGELSAIFPDEEAGISRFFGHLREISSFRERLAEEGSARSRRSESLDAASYVKGLIKDWRLRRILGSMGSREPYSGMTLLAAMWSLLCEKGIHHPAGGMRRLADLLAERLGWKAPSVGDTSPAAGPSRFSAGPGSLLLRTAASGILVEDGRARGIVLEDGTRFDAGAVISNADFKTTFLRLLPREALTEDLFRAVTAARQTSSNLQVCLGVDASIADLSVFRESSRVIYRRDGRLSPDDGTGLDWDAPRIDPHALAGEELEATLLSADDPSLAPEGHAVLVIRTAAEHRHFTPFRPGRGRRAPEYLAYKMELAEALVKEVSGFVPGLEEAVAYMDVATPLTFEERGGRSEGAVAGWSWDYLEGADQGAVELIRTPIAGLYMAGYQAFSMLALGGVPSAMLSGLKAAEYLVAGAGPVSDLAVPGQG